MKEWVEFICCINPRLDKLYSAVAEKIEKTAFSQDRTCKELFDELCGLEERKRKLINVRVLYNALIDGLTDEESEIIKGDTDDAPDSGQSRMTLNRKKNSAYLKASKIMSSLGYCADKMKKEYSGWLCAVRSQFGK